MNKNINKELAIQKGLIVNENNELYKNLEKVYKYLFECFWVSSVNIHEYNTKIKMSNLDFGVPHPTNEQLISGLPEYLNLEYIYLLNNFFIEKLDINDINILKEYMVNSDFKIDDNKLDFVRRTYKEVIKNNYHNGKYREDVYKVSYGFVIPSNMCDNDSVVIKIYYSKNTFKMNDEEFINNMKEKDSFLKSLCESITSEVKEKLGINCNIIVEKIPN